MNRIASFACAAALAVSLGGCMWNPFASIQNPINKNALADVEATYGAAEAIAVGYRDSCNKKLIDRSCRDIVLQIQDYSRKAQAAMLVARSFVKTNPTVDASVVIRTAMDAVNAFKNFENTNGVQ